MNIYEEGELDRKSTIRNFRIVQSEGKRKVARTISYYNLDVIISVGYRVKSLRGTEFRIWATKILRDHIVRGYTINQQRLIKEEEKYRSLLTQLQTLRSVLDYQVLDLDGAKGLIRVITDYATGLELLEQFDKGELTISKQTQRKARGISYHSALGIIQRLRAELRAGMLFGRQKDEGFQSSLLSIFQTYNGEDLYPSIEEKAANLLYLIIKNHPFVDGNKRIGAFMFLRFLDMNKLLYDKGGKRLLEQSTLVAIALMIARSDPGHKNLMIKLVVNLLNKNGSIP